MLLQDKLPFYKGTSSICPGSPDLGTKLRLALLRIKLETQGISIDMSAGDLFFSELHGVW